MGSITNDVDQGNTQGGNVPSVDPIIEFLSNINVSDDILHELDACGSSQEKYEKYYRATDLFILKDILGNVRAWDQDPEDVNYKAFNNLIKWFMYLIAVNPWWHRKLCYYNRMMGANMNSASYWHLQYHPGYIPGTHWNEGMDKSAKEFNDEQTNQKGIYEWIDEEVEKYQE